MADHAMAESAVVTLKDIILKVNVAFLSFLVRYPVVITVYRAYITNHVVSRSARIQMWGEKTMMSQTKWYDWLERPEGEVLVHQNVMKTNLETAGSCD